MFDLPIIADDMPQYATPGAAGFDLKSREATVIPSGKVHIFDIGIRVAIPVGYELQIRSRSGMGINRRLIVAQGIGTIDSDYRGSIKVALWNTGREAQIICVGDRIAQGVVCPVAHVNFIPVLELYVTYRNDGALGSTGQ